MMSDNFWLFLTSHPPTNVQFLPYNVQFFGVISDPPSPPKIGHHLWTLPYINYTIRDLKSQLYSILSVSIHKSDKAYRQDTKWNHIFFGSNLFVKIKIKNATSKWIWLLCAGHFDVSYVGQILVYWNHPCKIVTGKFEMSFQRSEYKKFKSNFSWIINDVCN